MKIVSSKDLRGIRPKMSTSSFARDHSGEYSLAEIGEKIGIEKSSTMMETLDSGEKNADQILEQRIETARTKREELRQMNKMDEYISLELESFEEAKEDFVLASVNPYSRSKKYEHDLEDIGPLEMIAHSCVDEEVFEDLRGSKIQFGVNTLQTRLSENDLQFSNDGDDDEMLAWEEAQMKKGIASAGLMVSKNVRNAAKEISGKNTTTQTANLLEFNPDTEYYCSSIEKQVEKLMENLENCQITLESLNPVTLASALDMDANEEDVAKADIMKEMYTFFKTFGYFVSEKMTQLESLKLVEKESNPNLTVHVEAFFADALPEFGELSAIFDRLDKWKANYPSVYDHLSIEQNTPYILEVFIGYQLLLWNPLDQNSETINDLLVEIETKSSRSFDLLLKRKLVEQFYLPHLLDLLSSKFDPFSHEQTESLSNAVKEVSSVLSSSHKAVLSLFWIIDDLFEEAKDGKDPNQISRLDYNKKFIESIKQI